MKIAVVTGSRAEWGLLEPLVKAIKFRLIPTSESQEIRLAGLELQLYVTGSHLSPEFGETWKQIDYPITEKIECVLSSNTPSGIAKSMGLAMIGFGEAYERQRPDLVVVLGDRYEIFAAVSAAICAANGVLFLEPLKPSPPALAQDNVPLVSDDRKKPEVPDTAAGQVIV